MKRKKSDPSRLGLDSVLESDPLQQTQPTQHTQISQAPMPRQPCQTEKPSARRVVPEQVVATCQAGRSDQIWPGSSQIASRRVTPELIQSNRSRNASSSSSSLLSQHEAESQEVRVVGKSLHRAAVSCVESDLGSEADHEDGSDGGAEGGSEGGLDGVQPTKVIVEFGSAGDRWWHDFITAKEDMLTNVLQVNSADCCAAIYAALNLLNFCVGCAMCLRRQQLLPAHQVVLMSLCCATVCQVVSSCSKA